MAPRRLCLLGLASVAASAAAQVRYVAPAPPDLKVAGISHYKEGSLEREAEDLVNAFQAADMGITDGTTVFVGSSVRKRRSLNLTETGFKTGLFAVAKSLWKGSTDEEVRAGIDALWRDLPTNGDGGGAVPWLVARVGGKNGYVIREPISNRELHTVDSRTDQGHANVATYDGREGSKTLVINPSRIDVQRGFSIGYLLPMVNPAKGRVGYLAPLSPVDYVLVFQASGAKYDDALHAPVVQGFEKPTTAKKSVVLFGGTDIALGKLKGGYKSVKSDKLKDQYLDHHERNAPFQTSFDLDLGAELSQITGDLLGEHFRFLSSRFQQSLSISDGLLSSEKLDKDSAVPIKYSADLNTARSLSTVAVPIEVALKANQDFTDRSGQLRIGASRYMLVATSNKPAAYSNIDNAPIITFWLEGAGPFRTYGDGNAAFFKDFSGRVHGEFRSAKFDVGALLKRAGLPLASYVGFDWGLDYWVMQRRTSLTPHLNDGRANVGLTIGVAPRQGVRVGYATGANPTSSFSRSPGALTIELVSIK